MIKTSNSHLYELEVVKKSKPALAFDEKVDFTEWRKSAYDKLLSLLGLPLEAGSAFEIEYKAKKDGYTEYRFTVETEPGYFVPCYLLVPTGIEDKIPLTICLSGHGSGMHLALGVAKCEKDVKSLEEWPHRAMAPRSLREGRAALVVEARSFGESSLKGIGTSCTEAAKIALLMGRTTIGERVWDAMRILDAVGEHFDVIDMENIVCTGNSGGGTASYYLACVDERITVCAPSCSVCTYEGSIIAMEHCMCNHIPSIRKYFEMGDLAGLIAPRKLVVAAGELDDIFPIDETKKNYETIKLIYKSLGVPENTSLVIGDKGHLNYADLLWAEIHKMGF